MNISNFLFPLQTNENNYQRKKFFDFIDAIIYVGALSYYNEVCFEDGETNKINQNLDILEELVNQEIIDDIQIYLVLNKQDVFFKS
jgi:hypothetical protein